MEHISIFNYEAFYLDYLEGNLSEEDAALLMAFLEAHPELKIEEESLPVLEMESESLDQKFKADLKQINFNETMISMDNVEQFFIAETEGLLSTVKKTELVQFVAKDSDLLQAQKLYASTILTPDNGIVFSDKNSLKQSRQIVLWPYISVAAAASVAIMFFLLNPSAPPSGIAKNSSVKKPVKVEKVENQIGNNGNNEQGSTNKDQVIEKQNIFNIPANHESDPKQDVAVNVVQPDTRLSVGQLNTRKLKGLDLKKNNQTVIESSYPINTLASNITEPEDDYNMLGFSEMNNPIKPITNRLATAVNQEVDFRTAKANEKQSGGFFLKVGKLEISHRKF